MQLSEHGHERKVVAARLAEIEARLRPLVVEARANEVPYSVITEITGLSSRTIRAWTRADGEGGSVIAPR